MARARTNPNPNGGENKMATSTKGSLSGLTMIPVDDDVLDAARGGRGHGDYDQLIDQFLEAGIRGTEVGYDGVKPNSVKTGIKSAILRAEKAGKVQEGELGVKGKDEHVYLVKATVEA